MGLFLQFDNLDRHHHRGDGLFGNVGAEVGDGKCATAASQQNGGQRCANGFRVSGQPACKSLERQHQLRVLSIQPSQRALGGDQQSTQHSGAKEQEADEQCDQTGLD